MKLLALFVLSLCLVPAFYAVAQSPVIVKVINRDDSTAIDGATVVALNSTVNGYTDSTGSITLKGLPAGEQSIVASYLGFYRKKVKITLPQDAGKTIVIMLEAAEQDIAPVVIVSTRNEKTVDDLPTRVEVVDEEEVEERSHDKPSDVSHILKEQPGVQVQRTSATGGTMGVRLQGLNSRYTQVLKDGFPLFGGFSNVIGITQVPPLDVKQVEIIKGPSSTLYGGDAIAGVINLITKEPAEKPVYDIMANGETAKAADAGVYASQKIKWFAFALTGIYRYQKAVDWDGDKFSETPYLQRYSITPQLFFDLGKHAKLNIGGGYTHEYREGGALPYINGENDTAYSYYEKNLSDHAGGNLKFQYNFGKSGKLTVKSSVNYFNRSLTLPSYFFSGTQLGSASEVNYHFAYKQHDLVVGFDARSDRFTEAKDSAVLKRNYNYLTGGFFAQYSYTFKGRTTIEGGIRVDYNNVYKLYALPHIAIRQKWNDVFSMRLNAGMGYKLPTVFQDETEEARFINVLPIDSSVKPELSAGGTIDILVKVPNYNGLSIVINQLYYYTHLFRPLQADTMSMENCTIGDCSQLFYKSANGFQQSIGVESSFRLSYRGLNLGLIYTLSDNSLKIDDIKSIAPLTSKHIVSILCDYEIKNFSAGIDCYYYSPVKLSNGGLGKSIWEFGIAAQYAHKYFLLFANLENLFDIRQTSFGPIVFPNPDYNHPRFAEIYAPLEGRLFNAGIKIHLGAFSKKYKNDKGGGVERVRTKDSD